MVDDGEQEYADPEHYVDQFYQQVRIILSNLITVLLLINTLIALGRASEWWGGGGGGD